MPLRLLCAVAALGLCACLSSPPIHPRAIEDNESCVQKLRAGDLASAEIYCDHGLEFSPQYADLWNNKGAIALRQNQFDLAKEYFKKAVHLNQDLAQAWNNLGYVYLQHEKSYGKAHDSFQRALKVNPDYIEARYNLALTFAALGEKEKARKEYLTILSVNPGVREPWHDLGVMALKDGDLEKAVSYLREAVKQDRRYADAWLNLGLAYSEGGKFEQSAEAYRSCVEVDPDNSACRNNLAPVVRQGALLEEGLKKKRDALVEQKTPDALYELAQLYQTRGLKDEEQRTYKECLKLDSRFPACHFGLFSIFSAERKDTEAKIACKNFLKFAPAEEFPQQTKSCEQYLGQADQL